MADRPLSSLLVVVDEDEVRRAHVEEAVNAMIGAAERDPLAVLRAYLRGWPTLG